MKNKLKIIGCINERFFRLNSWQKGVFIGVLISFLSLIKFELINIFTNIPRHIFWYVFRDYDFTYSFLHSYGSLLNFLSWVVGGAVLGLLVGFWLPTLTNRTKTNLKHSFIWSIVILLFMIVSLYFISGNDASWAWYVSIVLIIPASVTVYSGLVVLNSDTPDSSLWKVPLVFLGCCLILWLVVFLSYSINPGEGLGSIIAFTMLFLYTVFGLLSLFIVLIITYLPEFSLIFLTT